MTQDLHVIVDEPIPGHFYWLIAHLGREREANFVLDYARGPLPTRESATLAATTALSKHQQEGASWADSQRGNCVDWSVETIPGALH